MSKQNAKKRKGNSSMIWWVAGIAVVIVGGMIALSLSSGKTQSVAPVTVKSDTERHADKNVLGSPTAKVQLVEWGDYL